jgi:hypothetical protein
MARNPRSEPLGSATRKYDLDPAIVTDNTQTIVVVPGATGTTLKDHVVLHVSQKREQRVADPILLDTPDLIKLSTFGHSE